MGTFDGYLSLLSLPEGKSMSLPARFIEEHLGGFSSVVTQTGHEE